MIYKSADPRNLVSTTSMFPSQGDAHVPNATLSGDANQHRLDSDRRRALSIAARR